MKSEKVKKIKSQNSSWNFETDQINFYAFWNDFLSKEECQKIINIAKNKGFTKGKVKEKDLSNERKSKVSWLYPSDDMDWLYRRVTDVVINLNERFFQFDLFGLNEGFQFTNYVAPSGKYGKHVDRCLGFPVRKLSMSIQLTDPKEYEGGELCLYQEEKGFTMDKRQGTLILFPSFILHEVKPVTKGERNSLVTWVTGKQFK